MKRIPKWAAWGVACAALPAFAMAASTNNPEQPDNVSMTATAHENTGALQDARHQVAKAAQVLAKMKRDPQASRLLREAKGVLIMPEYGRGAIVVGGGGGPGVLVARHGGHWNGPALYNVGSVSVGAQVGGSGGAIAMILMTNKALRQFEQSNDFALNADAGITVWNASARGHGRTGGDVAMWSDTKGLYAGATVGVTDINFDEHETAALYGKRVQPAEILNGHTPMVQAASSLMDELPAA